MVFNYLVCVSMCPGMGSKLSANKNPLPRKSWRLTSTTERERRAGTGNLSLFDGQVSTEIAMATLVFQVPSCVPDLSHFLGSKHFSGK